MVPHVEAAAKPGEGARGVEYFAAGASDSSTGRVRAKEVKKGRNAPIFSIIVGEDPGGRRPTRGEEGCARGVADG
jgi:hypothetical protein